MNSELPPKIESRQEMIEWLTSTAHGQADELSKRRQKKPLVKTLLVEAMGGSSGADFDLGEVLKSLHIAPRMLEDDLYAVSISSPSTSMKLPEPTFVERLSNRLLMFTTTELSENFQPGVRKLVRESSRLDHIWVAAIAFRNFWEEVKATSERSRYIKMGFQHANFYETEDDELSSSSKGRQERRFTERMNASLKIVDRISRVDNSLSQMQSLYSPLWAINQLRFPSDNGPGGNDFYFDGRLTNRSNYVEEHRNTAKRLAGFYQRLLDNTEKIVWTATQERFGLSALRGAPVTIRFSGDGLSTHEFDRWVESTFTKGRLNRFRLMGTPIVLGAHKIHVNAVDYHLWQPLFIEATRKLLTVIVPKGTCGNSVHRLVVNIQRYLDPHADVHLGDTAYDQVIIDSLGVHKDATV